MVPLTFPRRFDAPRSVEVSFEITRQLRLFLGIDMLVCLQAMRRDRNAQTRVIHLVMPLAIVFMSTHLGVTSGVASSRRCRDLSDSRGHAS